MSRAQPTVQDLERRSDDELVELFATLRDAGSARDRTVAVRAWHVLVARSHDRIRAHVATFRFPGNEDVRVAPADRDDVVQLAHERCLEKLVHNFRGTSAAEFRAAVRTCTRYACMDHCREAMRREQRLEGSIDERAGGTDGDGELGRFDRALAELNARMEDGRFGAALDLDAVARALEEVPNPDMRVVIRRTIEGHTSREIADELGTTVANVDQLRSRGLRRLRGILGGDG